MKNLLIIICLFQLISLKKEFLKNFNSQSNNNLGITDYELITIRNTILNNHNIYRKRHQVNKLVTNPQIELIAQQYAENLALKGIKKYSSNTYYGDALGENIFISYNSFSGEYVSQSWYEENQYYNYYIPEFNSLYRDFTQMVWKDTEEMGCGASCTDNICAVVCNYYPAGNIEGYFRSNVFPSDNYNKNDENIKNEAKTSNTFLVILAIFGGIICCCGCIIFIKKAFM